MLAPCAHPSCSCLILPNHTALAYTVYAKKAFERKRKIAPIKADFFKCSFRSIIYPERLQPLSKERSAEYLMSI